MGPPGTPGRDLGVLRRGDHHRMAMDGGCPVPGTDLGRRTGVTDRPSRWEWEKFSGAEARCSREGSLGPAGTTEGATRMYLPRGTATRSRQTYRGQYSGSISRGTRGALARAGRREREVYMSPGLSGGGAAAQGARSATSPAYATKAPRGTWDERGKGVRETVGRRGQERLVGGLPREPTGTSWVMMFREARGCTAGSAADGPPPWRGRGGGDVPPTVPGDGRFMHSRYELGDAVQSVRVSRSPRGA